MGRSAAFARIQDAVLALVNQLGPGELTTLSELAQRLDVPARHVAYVLSLVRDQTGDLVPWHRVIGTNGAISNGARGLAQRALLVAEGVVFGPRGRIQGLAQRLRRFPRPPGPPVRYDEVSDVPDAAPAPPPRSDASTP